MRRRFHTPNQFLQTATEIGFSTEEFCMVAGTESVKLKKRIFDTFFTTYRQRTSFLWEHLRENGVVLGNAHTFHWIDSFFPAETNIFILIKNGLGNNASAPYWLFKGQYRAVINTIGETCGLGEFYIIDRKLNWILLENHHDVVIAIGEPAESQLISMMRNHDNIDFNPESRTGRHQDK